MITLALDTSFGTSVALLQDDRVLAEINYPETITHAERIGQAIADLLHETKLVSAEVDRVVIGIGPGQFTGLRVGIAAAKFFSIGANAELVGVCSLDSIAQQYYQNGGSESLLVTTDARRKERFWAKYSGVTNGVPVRTAGPSVNKPEEIAVEGCETTELVVSAASLGLIAFSQGKKVNRDVTPIYLREPDATPGKGKRVSG